ncbi:HNH endonuclease [Qipengyuania spongiae]|uniref:HNH endonuclease n=1 Tax=Qipengyuania spongiae TaxID=2909673 RepID=UPI003B96A4AA
MPNSAPVFGRKPSRKPWDHGKRESRHARGYGTAWEKLRKVILQRDKHLCQPCKRAGRITVAQAVDHILAKANGGTDDPANLQAICTPCHNAKLAEDQGKRSRTRPTFGADGWPIEEGKNR